MSDFKAKMHQIQFPDPAGGAYSAPPDPRAGGEGARCPLPRTPPPLSALRASMFGPAGLSTRPFGPRCP